MRKTKLFSTLALLSALALAPMRLHAETLADHVPADALLYAQWSGSDAQGAAYENSNYKGFIDALNIPQLLADHMAQEQAKQTDPQKAADMQAVHELIPLVMKAESGFYVGPFDVSVPQEPHVKIAAFSSIGKANADKYAATLTDIIQRKEKENPDKKHPPVAVVSAGDFLLLTMGEGVDFDKYLSGTAVSTPLSGDEAYKSALSQVHATDTSAAIVYLNGEATLKTIDGAVSAGANPRMAQMWPMIEDAMGLSSIRSGALAGNFDGKDFHTEVFVGLRQRRVGLIAFLDNAPLTDDALKAIPKAATWASIARFDGARLMTDLRDAFTAAGPRPAKQFDFAMQQFFAFTGVDLEKDLFASLGDQYTVYGVPDANGKSFDNITMVSKLKDPAKADTALSSLESSISAMITQRDPNGTVSFNAQPLPAPFDKVTAHVITTPLMSPAWAVTDGNLYGTLNTTALQNALSADKTSSILDNPTFAATRTKLDAKQFSAFFYNDMVATAPETYDLINDGIKRMKEAQSTPSTYTLPPLEKLTPYLSPTAGFFWTDADGFHVTMTGPFPFSNALNPQSMILRKWMMQLADRRKPKPAAPATP